MEEDRLQSDLGIAADIEEAQLMAQSSHPAPTETETTRPTGHASVKQPKKRFVGRRAAAEAAAKNGGSVTTGESGAVAGRLFPPKTSSHYIVRMGVSK
jgi:2-(3-amino-3-carboxypropyl)histidine synthase